MIFGQRQPDLIARQHDRAGETTLRQCVGDGTVQIRQPPRGDLGTVVEASGDAGEDSEGSEGSEGYER
jgi:hypothetical protein